MSEADFARAYALIVKERRRQIHEEGFDIRHDLKYISHELHAAALCYWYEGNYIFGVHADKPPASLAMGWQNGGSQRIAFRI